MNYITELQTTLACKEAEIAALRDGLKRIVDYCQSEKFNCGPWPEVHNVNPDDIVLRARETLHDGDTTFYDTWRTIVGPRPEASYQGWRCPDCHDPLPGPWNDSEPKANERMRLHWTEKHTTPS